MIRPIDFPQEGHGDDLGLFDRGSPFKLPLLCGGNGLFEIVVTHVWISSNRHRETKRQDSQRQDFRVSLYPTRSRRHQAQEVLLRFIITQDTVNGKATPGDLFLLLGAICVAQRDALWGLFVC